MAIDDVVSDTEISVAGSASTEIRPASGDEWLLGGLFSESDTASDSDMMTPGGQNLNSALNAGETSVTGARYIGNFCRDHRIFLTNDEYLKMINRNSGTLDMGFSAIKTKD